MNRRFPHSALLGAFLVSVAAFLELLMQATAHPYQRDWGLYLSLLPLDWLVGALLGVAAALVLPWLSPATLRHRYPGLALASLIVPGGATTAWFLHRAFATDGALEWSQLPTQLGLPLVVGVVLLLVLQRLAVSPLGWWLASFFTPWFALVGNLACLALALLLAAIGTVAAPGTPTAPPPSPKTVPNVLLVVLDTVRADHLGCYGSTRPTSPRLDALAEEGVVFERAFAAAPWTLPSHASIFTGLYPQSHGTGWTHRRLDDGAGSIPGVAKFDHWTLAEELGSRGWQTCGISDKPWLSSVYGTTQGFQQYFDFGTPLLRDRLFLPQLMLALDRRLGRWRKPIDKGGQRVTETAMEWLAGDHGRNPDRPFFLFLNLNEAHAPYRPPADFPDRARFLPPGTEIAALAPPYFAPPQERKARNAGVREAMANESEIQQGLYDALILYQDGLLGRLFDSLRDQRLMENTLVIVTADHGEEFHEQGLSGHQLSLSDRLLHVPLILRYPSLLPAGSRRSGMVSLVDLYPTILDVLEQNGCPPRQDPELQALEGSSLVGLARGEVTEVRDWVHASYQNPAVYLQVFPGFDEGADFGLRQEMRSIDLIRSDHQKFFRYGDGAESYLDLQIDPFEATATAPPPTEQSAQVTAMRRALATLEHRLERRRELLLGRRHWMAQGGRSATTTMANLEALGYLGEVGSDSTADQAFVAIPATLFGN